MRLDAAVVLVTGSSQEVGRAIGRLRWVGYGNIAVAKRAQ